MSKMKLLGEDVFALARASIALGKADQGIELLIEVIESIIPNLRPWIDVSEKLPTAGELVIVDGGVGKVDRQGVWWSMTGYYSPTPIQWEVRRWMPLPK